MTQLELMADILKRNLGMVKFTLEDFSDADMLARPVPAANHAAWQLGHLILAETGMLKGAGAANVPSLPAGFEEKFNKQTATTDDAGFFPRKSELIDAFTTVRSAFIAWVGTLAPADLDRPTPERMQKWAPTVGHVISVVPEHVAMHVGQFQVIRRKLGKPVLF
jgi:hypothetical protein